METSTSAAVENKPSLSPTQTMPKQTEVSSTPSSDKYVIRGIHADVVDKFWHLAEPYVKRALDHANGEVNHHDIKVFIQNRDMQLWLVANKTRVVGAATTEIIIYPRKKVIRVVTLSGNNFPDWFDDLEAMISAYGASLECEGIEVIVRPGFTKKLATHKFKKYYEMCYLPFF